MAASRKGDTFQYVRDGECDEIFTTRVGTGELIFEDEQFVQTGGLIPMSDVHDVLYSYASFLCIQNQEPRGKFAVGVDRATVEALIISSVLVKDSTPELMGKSQPDHTMLAWAVKNNLQAHGVAEKILELVNNVHRFSMNMFIKILVTSDNVKLTEDLLQVAGPSYPEMFCNDVQLKRLATKMPDTLPADELLSFKCTVLSVSSPDKSALVKITQIAPGPSQELLKFLPENVSVTFGSSSSLKSDLLIAQLNEDALWLLVSAVCPTSTSSAARKKASLVVMQIMHEKTNTQDAYLERRRLLKNLTSRQFKF
jgi:hypothetical protein